MHDEASPHYVEMVENTARGHTFLKKEFGITPKGTWQIGELCPGPMLCPEA